MNNIKPNKTLHSTAIHQVRHLYWAIDNSKYWTMEWPVQETMIINRTRVDAPEPWRNG